MFPLLLLSLCCSVEVAQTQLQFISFTPYISPATVLLSYEKMVQNLKVFMYKPNKPQLKCATTVESLFYSSLQNSTYLTQDPEEAHLFFFPFFLNLSTRFLARVLTRIRKDFILGKIINLIFLFISKFDFDLLII